MPQVQDEDIRIYRLPEAQELASGMKVAVDSETDGTKSFDLSNLAGKVDEPETAPEAGQVLTFDGTENTWANPPEGVYVLNYSEVTDYSDIDVERAGSQPTFIKIDEPVQITVRGISGTTTVNMQHQLMQLTDYNVNNGWHIFRGRNMASFPGNSPTADRVGSNYNYEVVLQILSSEITATPKLWSVFGEWVDGSNIFNTEPQPYTISYNNGKGSNLSGKDGFSTAIQFTASDGTYRKNLLMPAEIQDHDFSNDSTPEQIQFMGWGATSNRAGYKTIREVPTSTAQDEGKVLTIDSNGGAVWGQSGFVVTLTEDLTTSPSTLSIDKSFTEINTAIQSSQSIKFNYDKKSPIGTVRVFSGSDVQTVYGSYIAFNCVGSNGKVTSVRLNVSDTVSIVESNNLPTSTSSDEGKVLTVDSNGAAVWTTRNNSVEIITANSPSTILSEFTRIRAAGKIPALWYNGATFDGVSHDVLCEWKYDTQSGEHVFLGSCIVTPDWNPHPRLYWVTYTQSSDFTSGGASFLGLTNIPQTTSSDSDKVLTVDSNGAPVWTEPPTEIAMFDANYSYPPVPFANYPTFAELNDARLAGKVPIIVQITSTGEHIYYMPTLVNVDENQVKFHFVNPETGVILKLEGPTSNPVWSSTTVVGISSYGTRTESGIVDGVLTIYGGNSLTKLKLTTVQSITVKANEGTPNFALEIDNTDNSNDVTVTVVDFADTTLNSSVSGGSTVGAGKYVQLTCVGSCWTLAEFANPS